MKPGGRFGGVCALWLLVTGCATTGDSRQGGLFGWSESKARRRQQERQDQVGVERAELNRQDAIGRRLEASSARADQQIATAKTEHQRLQDRLRTQQAALVAKTGQLETESPTPAGASRARAYRRKVNTVAAQTALPAAQRSIRLQALEVQIDRELDQLKR